MTTHTMFDGRLQVYRRTESGPWQAAARVGGQRFRQSTGEASLNQAKDVAEERYLDLAARKAVKKPTYEQEDGVSP